MNMLRVIVGIGATSFSLASATGATLYDNGGPNGINGYSNATSGVFGFRRALLDDFEVPAGGWTLQELHWNSVWGTPMGGAMGTGAEISIRSDVSGTPAQRIAEANITAYSESATGNIYFSREEVAHWATFDDIALAPGHYWFEATVAGPENNFWLTADRNFNACWVNYEDLGGLLRGVEQFGTDSDINFILNGVPAPGTLAALLCVAGSTGRRRRA